MIPDSTFLVLLVSTQIIYSLSLAVRAYLHGLPVDRVDMSEIDTLQPDEYPQIVLFYPVLRELEETMRTTFRALARIDYPGDRYRVIAIPNDHDTLTVHALRKLAVEFPFVEVLEVPATSDPRWQVVWDAWDRCGKAYWWHAGRRAGVRDLPPKKTRQLVYGFYSLARELAVRGDFLVNYIDADSCPPQDHFLAAAVGMRHYDVLQSTNVAGNLNDSWAASFHAMDHMAWDGQTYPHLSAEGRQPYWVLGKGLFFRASDLVALGGFHPWLTIEDPEVGMRFWANGKRLGIIENPLIEEVPTTFAHGITQRKRWVAGFFQSLASPLGAIGMTPLERARAWLNFLPCLSMSANTIGFPVGALGALAVPARVGPRAVLADLPLRDQRALARGGDDVDLPQRVASERACARDATRPAGVSAPGQPGLSHGLVALLDRAAGHRLSDVSAGRRPRLGAHGQDQREQGADPAEDRRPGGAAGRAVRRLTTTRNTKETPGIMTKGHVLITGGAGFIGSHLTDTLLERGYRVTVLDCLLPQVHADGDTDAAGWPTYLDRRARRVRGNLLDDGVFEASLDGVTHLVHLAASVGVGQSMTNIVDYTRNNVMASAIMLDVLSRMPRLADGSHPIRRIAVASSMSIYGEGAYADAAGRPVVPGLRSMEQLASRAWELTADGAPLVPVPTPEQKPLQPASIYAVNKRDHEEMFLAVGRALGIPTGALRLFNVYGSRQALGNPYTGVAAIFISRLLNDQPPLVFEDGEQRRDFVHVSDVADAFAAVLEHDRPFWDAFNVGSGRPVTVNEIARTLARLLHKDIQPLVLGKARVGDIRHCYPDISKVRAGLGFAPRRDFDAGMAELVDWVGTVRKPVDRTAASLRELDRARLVL